MIRGDRARRALFVRREQKPKLHVMATDRDHNQRGDDHHTRGVRVDGERRSGDDGGGRGDMRMR